MDPWRGSLGALFVSVYFQVRVFWLSGIIYRPSDHMYIRTIPMSECMDRRSRYTLPEKIRDVEKPKMGTLKNGADSSSLSPKGQGVYNTPFKKKPKKWSESNHDRYEETYRRRIRLADLSRVGPRWQA